MKKSEVKQRPTRSAKIDPNKPAAIIVNGRFDGLTHFCNLTGFKISTVHGWLCSGYIPNRQKGTNVHARIFEIAQANRIKVLATDFVEKPGQVAANGEA